MAKKQAAWQVPTPCTTYVPDLDGNMVVASVETRERVRFSNGFETDTVVNTLRIMAEQETGEEIFVAYANRKTVDAIQDAHMLAHPEHRAIWSESIK